MIDASLNRISTILGIRPNEIVFTSGATESNNMAIKGIAYKYKNRGKKIITTKLEHSSVLETVNFLNRDGFNIEYVPITKDGIVDLNELDKIQKNLYSNK